jgi:hypothetical protein
MGFAERYSLTTLQLCKNNLGALVQANPPTSNSQIPAKRFEFRERIKFTMKRRKLQNIMERMELCVRRLSEFSHKAEKLKDSTPRDRQRVRYSGSLGVIRQNASKIHQVLLRSWCNMHPKNTWCGTHPEHRAGLLLEQRIVRKVKMKHLQQVAENKVTSSDCFALYLDEPSVVRKWLTTEVRVFELPSR